MVFFSPYKSSRILGKDTLMRATIRRRDLMMYYFARPWATGWMYYVTEARFVIAWVTGWYLVQRSFTATIEEDEYQRSTIRRWGNSVENVRRQLSPADQVRVRVNLEKEMYYGFFLPEWWKKKPEGMPWPAAEAH